MAGLRILQRFGCPWCGERSAPLGVDDDDTVLFVYCTEPLGHTTDHLARIDGEVVHRWNRAPYPSE